MIKPEIEHIRQKLLSLRAELQGPEESPNEAAKPMALDQDGIGRLSRRDAMQVLQKHEEVARQHKRHLQKIDGALRRIEAGEYGRCFMCEKEIDALRLSEDPTSTRCMNCIEL